MTFEDVLEHFPGAKKTPTGWRVRCPVHNGVTNSSLSIARGREGQTLLHCFGGCQVDAVLAAAGLSFSDLGGGQRREDSIRYVYRSADGVELMTVHRLPGKEFRQQAADGQWTAKHVPKVTYHLPELRAGIARGETVWIAEGEKDVENLERLGLVATCNASGAGKWVAAHTACLEGASRVIIIADKDQPGRNHAELVARSLNGTPKGIVEVPVGKDATDWINAGATKEDFEALAPALQVLRGKAEDTPATKPKAKLRFVTVDEMIADMATEAKPRAMYLMDGCITELDGYLKLGGKTTLALAMVKAVIEGTEFLGSPAQKGKVIYLNESAPRGFAEALEGADLLGSTGLEILNFHSSFGLSWQEKIDGCIARALETQANVIVVDTFSQWAGVTGDAENSAGAMMEAILPLQKAAGAGLAVVIIRHTRKSGGGVGVSARGSTAVAGAVDIIVEISRQDGNSNQNQRLLSYVGRFGQFPSEIVAEWDDDLSIYRAVGSPKAAKTARIEADVIRAMGDETWVIRDLQAELKASGDHGYRKQDLINALRHLVQLGFVHTSGVGKCGDPKVYSRPKRSVPVLKNDFSQSETPF